MIDFAEKQEMEGNDKKAIAKIVKEGFWGKMGNFFRKVNSDEAVDILEQCITYKKGFYYKEKGHVLGAVLLETTDIPYINFSKQAKRKLGFWNGTLLQLGFATMKPKRDDGLKLAMIAVSPEARGKGVGTKLLDYLNDITIHDGYKRATLEVIDSNDKAKDLYERMGYKCVRYSSTALFTRKMGFRGYYKMQKEIGSFD